MEDVEIQAPKGAALITAGCNVCRVLLVTDSPERAIQWGLTHAHTGNLTIMEAVAYQE